MDGQWLDAVARLLAPGASRRRLLTALTGGAIGGRLGALRPRPGRAAFAPVAARFAGGCLGVDEKFAELGGGDGFLGPAKTDETVAPDGVGHFRHYEGGSIYWSPSTCAHEVHGAIRDKWEQLGWEKGWLGYPRTDELPTPDGVGRFNHFQGGSIYWSPRAGAEALDIGAKFDRTRRNDGGTMHDHLKMYKDNVAVLGTVIEPLGASYPANAGRTYADLMCGVDDGQFDGDITFRIRIDRAELDAQPDFWTAGWFNDPNHIRRKLDHDTNNQMHPEIIMYGRALGKELCLFRDMNPDSFPPLLPGWMEDGANSALLDGQPINGQVDFGSRMRVLGREIPVDARVRVTGFLALDCHGLFGDCVEDDADKNNVELHPVYSIDVLG